MNKLKRVYGFLRQTKHAYQNYVAKRELSKSDVANFTANYIDSNTANWLRWFEEYKDKPSVKLLEVGSFEGRAAIWFLEHILTHPEANITCVDVFWGDGREARFDHNLRAYRSKMIKYKGKSEVVLQGLEKETYDIVYIDGSHHSLNVLMDAHLCWGLLKPGGMLLFDDYLWELKKPAIERPQLAIDLFLEAFQDRFSVVHKGYQVIVRKR